MTEGSLWAVLPAVTMAFAFGYLAGSIPFGFLITRLAGSGDIRAIGSGNIGATNVLRTGRRELAAATLLGDVLKGTLAVLVAMHYGGPNAGSAAALGAFLGHLFPPWLGFKGGKGVAVFIGLLLALAWPVALAFVAIWLAIAATTRYSSLSALIASAATPVLLWGTGYGRDAALFALLAVALWIMHRGNIGRLLSGTENRLGPLRNAAEPVPRRRSPTPD